jgi:hypothetical protein
MDIELTKRGSFYLLFLYALGILIGWCWGVSCTEKVYDPVIITVEIPEITITVRDTIP